METAMSNIIEVSQLERFFGEHRAVNGMTFTVEKGEVFGLLGPNGAGKTTTVRLLNGILPPSGGSARVFGLEIATQGDQIRQKTGVLTETPALYERLTARDNLAFFGTLTGIPENELLTRVDEMLEFFELSARADDKVETFSKGMKQRLALARALIHHPPLLFLDEPTSGLDPEAAQHVNDLIVSLSQRNGQTIVLATHNLTEAQRLCNRVAVMNQGRILALGSLDELSRKLWPTVWVDIEFQMPAESSLLASLDGFKGVLQVSGYGSKLEIQVESQDIIPEIVHHLSKQSAAILRVNPRDYTLEDIYFTLQKAGMA